jgi:glycerol uptake facilitator-like aquaporin
MIDRHLQRSLSVEFLGSIALSFFAVATAVASSGGDLIAIALAPGLATGGLLAAFGPASIGCFNPALTLSLLVSRSIDVRTATLAMCSQVLGAVAGALSLYAIYPSSAFGDVDRGAPIANVTVLAGSDAFTLSSLNAFAAEGIATFFLVLVFLGVRQTGNWPVAGLAIGSTITAAALGLSDVSSAILNPARYIGAALAFSRGDNAWVWIAGPVLGSFLASLLYSRVLSPEPKPE